MMMTSSAVLYEHQNFELSTGVTLHVARAGSTGAARVVLLHGWPETWYAWRHVAPYLTDFDIVMPDLRGLGESSIPETGYDKRTMAADIVALLGRLEPTDAPTFVVGHDWGGVVAFYVADLLRDSIAGLVVLDVTVPHSPSDTMSFNQGGKRWHHGFHRVPALPEQLIDGREHAYYGWYWDNFGADGFTVDADAQREYMLSYSNPARTRAGLALYREIPTDELNGDAVLANPLPMPVLALGGSETWGRGAEPAEVLRRFAGNVSGGAIPGSGHWLPEEASAEVGTRIQSFVASNATLSSA
jgi:pimeloyl-ACP methyl ester carboxylesterase